MRYINNKQIPGTCIYHIAHVIMIHSKLLQFLIFAAFTTFLVDGCKCVQPTLPTTYQSYSDVIRVKVLARVSRGRGTNKVTEFNGQHLYVGLVQQSYKGKTQSGDFVFVTTPKESAACGVTLRGKTYLLTTNSAGQRPGVLAVNLCGYNRPWKDIKTNRNDMEFLNDVSGQDGAVYRYYSTCGDPVCRGYDSSAHQGVPSCGPNQEVGMSCTRNDDGTRCDPRSACNAERICSNSDPASGPGGCPKSRRSTKRDISYLDTTTRDYIANNLLDFRLATWNYNEDPVDMTPRLGFIIEDVLEDQQHPAGSSRGSPAVDTVRDVVDVYGYLSMAVAAIQSQQEEIGRLRSDLESLQKKEPAVHVSQCPARAES